MTDRIKIHYLKEDGFRKQMKQAVEPYLKKYRRQGRIESYDGTQIFYYSYVREHAKGCIVISHGFSEFAEKYNEVVYTFLQAGYSVFLPEHRGHGRSTRGIQNPEKIYVESFAQYVRDFRFFVHKIVKPYQNEMFLFAHSMGGAIGALYLQRYPGDFQKAVLSAPMIQMRTGGLPYSAAMVLAHLCKMCGFGRAYAAGQRGFSIEPRLERSSCLSKERHLYAHRKRLLHPKFRTSGAVYSWVCAADTAAHVVQAQRQIQKIRIPVLVLAAGRDHMVDTNEICRFAGKLKDARLVWFLDAKHEIFHAKESDRLRFYEEIFLFLSDVSV